MLGNRSTRTSCLLDLNTWSMVRRESDGTLPRRPRGRLYGYTKQGDTQKDDRPASQAEPELKPQPVADRLCDESTGERFAQRCRRARESLVDHGPTLHDMGQG